MGSWHATVSPCHCDNRLYCGLMFLKRNFFKSCFIKRVVTQTELEDFRLFLVALGVGG
jgi:hypothetical protein